MYEALSYLMLELVLRELVLELVLLMLELVLEVSAACVSPMPEVKHELKH